MIPWVRVIHYVRTEEEVPCSQAEVALEGLVVSAEQVDDRRIHLAALVMETSFERPTKFRLQQEVMGEEETRNGSRMTIYGRTTRRSS
jgi:hypothetical protein